MLESRAWALALGLALAACGDGHAELVLRPLLTCAQAVRCDVIEWQLGVRHGPRLAGLHGGCRCVDASAGGPP